MIPSDLNLPTDIATTNAWLRSFYATVPIIHDTVNFHSSTIFDNINFTSVPKELSKQIYVIKRILRDVIKEFILIGECFVNSVFDEDICIFSEFKIIDPNYVVVKKDIINGDPIYSRRPGENLRRAIKNNKTDIVNKLNKIIIDAVNNDENIPVNPFYFSHLFSKMSTYDIRGTSFLHPCLGKLQEEKFDDVKNTIMYPYEKFTNVQLYTIITFYREMAQVVINWLSDKIFQPVCKNNNIPWDSAYITFNPEQAISKLEKD